MVKSQRSFTRSAPHASGGPRSHSGDTPYDRGGTRAAVAGDCGPFHVPCHLSALGARDGEKAR